MRRNNGIFPTLVFLILAVLICVIASLTVSASETPKLSARAATLYEPKSGRFLYSHNEDTRLAMASTTKIMTALVAAQKLSPDETVIIPKEAVGTEGSSAYLTEGEELTVKELLYALLLRSANDASVSLAIHTSGSVESFALLMNEKADALGLKDTNFTNPHGLPDEEHFTSAHDLAIIAAEALKDPLISEICATQKAVITSNTSTRTFLNHNKLLHLYDGCVGVKTGFTKAAGRCLVGAALRDGVTLISVTLNAPDDWNDHKRLFDLGFELTESRLLARRGEYSYSLPVIGADGAAAVKAELSSDVRAVLLKTDKAPAADVRLSRYFTAPIEAGQKLGEVIFTLDGKVIARGELTAKESVPKAKKKGFLAKIKDFFKK